MEQEKEEKQKRTHTVGVLPLSEKSIEFSRANSKIMEAIAPVISSLKQTEKQLNDIVEFLKSEDLIDGITSIQESGTIEDFKEFLNEVIDCNQFIHKDGLSDEQTELMISQIEKSTSNPQDQIVKTVVTH